MRTINPRGRLYRHFTKTYGCRAWLRLPIVPSLFLSSWRHRPITCNHNTGPLGWAGDRP